MVETLLTLCARVWLPSCVSLHRQYLSDLSGQFLCVQQFCCTGDDYLKRARSRKGVPQYIQLHGLLSRGEPAVA